MDTGRKRILVTLLIALAIPAALGAWWLERTIHWKLAYESKVEQKIESLTQTVEDLARRVEALEETRNVD